MPTPAIPETVVVVTEPFEGVAVDRWARLIAEAVQLRPDRLVVDLARSSFVDAAALAVLLQTHRAMVHSGGTLALRAPTPRVRRTLHLARLGDVFQVEDQNCDRMVKA